MQLNFKTLGNGPALVILHGLFGSLDNWMTLARRWSDHFSVWLTDARNHGKSPHSDVFTYEAMSDDLLRFLDAQGISKTHILGHSMGGKTAMRFTLDHSERVDRLIVADMAPVTYGPHHNEVFDALLGFPIASFTSRNEAEAWFSERIPDFATRQFILKSLDRTPEGGFAWKFNLESIYREYENILAGISASFPADNPALFIRGGKSPYVKDEYMSEIRALFPRAELHTLENAGHWVHAEAPEAFDKVVMDFLLR